MPKTLVASRAALQADGTSRALTLSRALQRRTMRADPAGAMSRVLVVTRDILRDILRERLTPSLARTKTNTHRARETREAEGRSATATAIHGEAETRRADATAAPRQDEGERGD
eukprot:7383648-Prymnesium_polylepis.1